MAALPIFLTALPNLGPGSQGNNVLTLQNALVAVGYLTPQQLATGPGVYGPQTTAAVARWQADNGVDTAGNPGYFGPRSKLFIQGAGNTQFISPSVPKGEYVDTPQGEVATADNGYRIPDTVLPQSMQNLSVYNLPPESFEMIVPQLQPGTNAYEEAMDKISTAFFDIMAQQVNATTQREQQASQYNWEQLRNYIQTNLNVSLSNDATQAWDQLQGLRNQFSTQNIQGSGMETESMDAYLRKIRTNDVALRSEAQTKQEAAQQDYYMKFATPEQVKTLIATNPDKARSWGLIPSDEMKASLSPAALKAKYPSLSDEDIQRHIASVLDENGNYRSSLYQRQMTGTNVGVNRGSVDTASIVYDQYGNPLNKSVVPSDTGLMDIVQAKEQYLNLNTPLAQQAKDYAERVRLGSIPRTSGEASATAAGTQFDQVQRNAPVATAPSTQQTSKSAGIPKTKMVNGVRVPIADTQTKIPAPTISKPVPTTPAAPPKPQTIAPKPVTPAVGMNTYRYVDASGAVRTVKAATSADALRSAPNIGRSSGVQLMR